MKISQFQVVTGFAPTPQIQLLLGTHLVSLQQSAGGQLLTINAPEQAPFELPRVVLRLADTVLNVAVDRLQLVVLPPAHIADSFPASVTFLRSRVTSMLQPLFALMPAYQWSGVVVEMEFQISEDPDVPATTMTNSLFDQLTTIKRTNRNVTSFLLNFGINEDGFFVGYTINEFEYRSVHLPPSPPPGGRLVVTPDQMTLGERGINILMDINNRQRPKNSPLADVDEIMLRQQRRFESLSDDLNLQRMVR